MTSVSGSASTLVPGDIYTLAGSADGAQGHSGDGGPATSALLGHVDDVVADSSGNLYMADTSNNRVQELAATTHTQWGTSMTAGDIYTIAGSSTGTSGTSGDGGAATSALLSAPTGVALDSSGDLFIADQANNRVQEVAATTHTQWGTSMTAGDIYTVAGTGTAGHSGDGGAAISARLDLPTGVAVDSAGDLFIADQYNNRAQEVAAATGTQRGQSMTRAISTPWPARLLAPAATPATAGRRPRPCSRAPTPSPSMPPATCTSPTPVTTGPSS